MFKTKKRLLTAIIAATLAIIPCQTTAAQEGVLHRLLRSAVAIPEAVLKSLHGPVKDDADPEKQEVRIRYPYPVQTNYGQSYGYAVPPDVLIHNSPGYVTYNVITARPAGGEYEHKKPDTHIYNPLPFDE